MMFVSANDGEYKYAHTFMDAFTKLGPYMRNHNEEITIFLFTSSSLVPLIDTFYGANGQDDGHNEKKNSPDNSSCNGFVFDLALNYVCNLLAGGLACQRV